MMVRNFLALLLVLVTTSSGSSPTQSNTIAIQNREMKTAGWWPIVQCFFLDDINKCLQDHSVRALVGLDRQDEISIDTEKEIVKLPGEKAEGIFEMIGDLVSDGISRLFQDDKKDSESEEDDEDEDGNEEDNEEDGDEADGVQESDNGDSNTLGHAHSRTLSVAENVQRSMETGRGKKKKKKKKKKMIKKAIIKLIILIILIKIKIAKFLFVFGKFLQFKMVMLITINTLINALRFFMEWKNKKSSEDVTYSQAHHQHHYDEHHHFDPTMESDDKGWLGGLWSRSGNYDGEQVKDAHDIAYSAQKPAQTFEYNARKLAQDTAPYAQRSAQDYAQNPTQNGPYYEHKPAQNVPYYAKNSNSNGQRSL